MFFTLCASEETRLFRRSARGAPAGGGKRMVPKILLFLLPALLLVIAIGAILLWDRPARGVGSADPGNGRSEGAFRTFYHVLWLLVFWSGLAFSVPLWFSYKEKLAGTPLAERWLMVGKIAIFPLVLLFLLRYGAKKGYLKWIDGLEWPDKENQ